MTKIGGRRFIMTMGCGIVCTLLVAFDHITDSIFRDIIIATVAVYIGGNTFQKVKAKNAGEADA
jgi:large-conductance mechanosensitive channel